MSRSERLFDLLHVLRRHRHPVSGQRLAEDIGVSLRTLYRDIASLQALGADIEGEPGVGYVLRPGFLLPPLMFTIEEIEALVLGTRWVEARAAGPAAGSAPGSGPADEQLRAAARSALTRIGAVLPPDLREAFDTSALLIGPGAARPADRIDPALLRKAIRTERKLALHYRDETGALTTRTIWPFALAFFDTVRVLLGWCELRTAFRSFRTDRIEAATLLEARMPRRRQVLLRQWRAEQKAAPRRTPAPPESPIETAGREAIPPPLPIAPRSNSDGPDPQ